MGKTYRRNAENGFKLYCKGYSPVDYNRRTKQPEAITEEWAIKRMKKHIKFVIDQMVHDKVIVEQERAECESKIQYYLLKAVPKYDPNHRSKHNAKTTSAIHYFTIVVDGIAANIREYWNFRRQYVHEVPITAEEPEVAEAKGMVSDEGEVMSDRYRSVKDLWFKMDLETLLNMLTPDEAVCLRMRILGYTDVEIGEHLGKDRHHVQKVLVKHIQAKARLCGFIPPSEMRQSEPAAKTC